MPVRVVAVACGSEVAHDAYNSALPMCFTWLQFLHACDRAGRLACPNGTEGTCDLKGGRTANISIFRVVAGVRSGTGQGAAAASRWQQCRCCATYTGYTCRAASRGRGRCRASLGTETSSFPCSARPGAAIGASRGRLFCKFACIMHLIGEALLTNAL